jgi:uncharacterized protein
MGSKGGQKRRRAFGTVIFLLLAVTAVAVIAYVIHSERQKKSDIRIPAKKERKVSLPSPIVSPETGQQPERKSTDNSIEKQPIVSSKPSSEKIQVAIIIDDIGYDRKILNEFSALDAPITFAVLPFCSHSLEAAKTLHKQGKEIILHLPMEPRNYRENRPGKGVLLVNMKDHELRAQLDADINAVPYIKGVNNHMGSRFMEDSEKVALVLKKIKQKGLFFIDSRTTPNSKGEYEAQRIGIPYATRSLFIDNDANYSETLNILMRLSEKSRQKDVQPLVIIGHPHSSTLEALKKALPMLKEKGVEVVSISDIINTKLKNKISHNTN